MTYTLSYDDPSVPKCGGCKIRTDLGCVEHSVDCTGGHNSNFWKRFDFLLPGGCLIFSEKVAPWTRDIPILNGCIERHVPLGSLQKVLKNKEGKPELDCRNYVYVLHQILSGKNTIHLYLGRDPTNMENDTNACYLHPSIDVLKRCNMPGVECSPRGQWIFNARCISPELKPGSYIGLNSIVEIGSLDQWKEKATSNLKNWIDKNKGKYSVTGITANIVDCLRKINPNCIKMFPRHKPLQVEPLQVEPLQFEPLQVEPLRFEPLRFEPLQTFLPRDDKRAERLFKKARDQNRRRRKNWSKHNGQKGRKNWGKKKGQNGR